MPVPSTHIVLVSDQPVPSLLPLLDPNLAVKRVVLVATPAREPHAQALRTALREAGLQVEPINLLRHPYDFPRLHRTFSQLVDSYIDQGVAANISGGNKLMSIAAYEVCKEKGQRAYYVNIDTDAVQWITPLDLPDHPLQTPLRMENYLHACGVQIESLSREKVSEEWEQIAEQLLNDHSFRSFNHHLLYQDSIPSYLQKAAEQKYFPKLVNSSIIKRNGHPAQFSSHESKCFLRGFWLEAVMFSWLSKQQHQGKIQDIVCNLKVRWRPEGSIEDIDNEFDVAFLAKNTLFLIECKSGGLKNNQDEMKKVIFQLGRSRQKLGGLRGKAFLVTINTLSENLRSRCLDNSVDHIQIKNGADLDGYVNNLLSGGEKS